MSALSRSQLLAEELVGEMYDLAHWPLTADVQERTIARWDNKIDQYANWVLAEAERALRERAAKLNAECRDDCGLPEATGLTEAADLLAGMRGDK